MVWVGTFKGRLVELWESLVMFLGFFFSFKSKMFLGGQVGEGVLLTTLWDSGPCHFGDGTRDKW